MLPKCATSSLHSLNNFFSFVFFLSPFIVSLSVFPLLHVNHIKLLYNKHEFLRFLKQGSGGYFYLCWQVFFPRTGEAEVAILPVCHISVSPSSGLKLNFRNSCISKPRKTNTFEGVSSWVFLWVMWTVEIEYDFYQVCNEIQNRSQKNIF